MRGLLRQQAGLTLVELMVSVALFGVVAMMIATLFVEFAIKRSSSDGHGNLMENLTQFSQMLEVYVTNTTELRACGCNIGNNCTYDPAMECMANPGSCQNLLLDFITEDSLDPGSFPGLECHQALNNPRVGTAAPGLIPRGCKKHIQIIGTAPTPMTVGNPSTVGTPGTIQIIDVTNNGWNVLMTLTGTYAVTCGMVGRTAGNPSGTQFYFDVRAKARLKNDNTAANPQLLEGWHPNDPNDRNFLMGLHRSYFTAIPFRNISQPGLYYGKTVTFDNCTRDGNIAPEGNCCSRYRDNTGRCVAQNDCIPAGTSPPDFSNLELASQWCCSHLISPLGVCR